MTYLHILDELLIKLLEWSVSIINEMVEDFFFQPFAWTAMQTSGSEEEAKRSCESFFSRVYFV